jgi:hypothetical protein
MSQLRSNHHSRLAIVDSLALHQDVARILDGSLVAATGFEAEGSQTRNRGCANGGEWLALFAVFETPISQGKHLESI